jgi:hypothetical protein
MEEIPQAFKDLVERGAVAPERRLREYAPEIYRPARGFKRFDCGSA